MTMIVSKSPIVGTYLKRFKQLAFSSGIPCRSSDFQNAESSNSGFTNNPEKFPMK